MKRKKPVYKKKRYNFLTILLNLVELGHMTEEEFNRKFNHQNPCLKNNKQNIIEGE